MSAGLSGIGIDRILRRAYERFLAGSFYAPVDAYEWSDADALVGTGLLAAVGGGDRCAGYFLTGAGLARLGRRVLD